MKAIYINIDPYLAAFAAWLKGGKVGPKPDFQPLPLAVTVPLGQSVGIYCPGYSGDEPASFLVDGLEMLAQAQGDFDPSTGTNIVSDITPGFSAFPHGTSIETQYYAVKEVTGSQISCAVKIGEYEEGDIATITFTVLVRREQASGPVDLVDFTPPVSLSGVSFAGVDIAGAEFDGNEIVANADTGALSAPAAGG